METVSIGSIQSSIKQALKKLLDGHKNQVSGNYGKENNGTGIVHGETIKIGGMDIRFDLLEAGLGVGGQGLYGDQLQQGGGLGVGGEDHGRGAYGEQIMDGAAGEQHQDGAGRTGSSTEGGGQQHTASSEAAEPAVSPDPAAGDSVALASDPAAKQNPRDQLSLIQENEQRALSLKQDQERRTLSMKQEQARTRLTHLERYVEALPANAAFGAEPLLGGLVEGGGVSLYVDEVLSEEELQQITNIPHEEDLYEEEAEER